MGELSFYLLLPYFLCDNVNTIILLNNTVYYIDLLYVRTSSGPMQCNAFKVNEFWFHQSEASVFADYVSDL